MYLIILFLSLFYFGNARESYLILRNSFLKFNLKLQNYHLRQILNNLSNNINKIHLLTLDRYYNYTFKYHSLSYENKELLDTMSLFI
jgi:hypothetical protein